MERLSRKISSKVDYIRCLLDIERLSETGGVEEFKSGKGDFYYRVFLEIGMPPRSDLSAEQAKGIIQDGDAQLALGDYRTPEHIARQAFCSRLAIQNAGVQDLDEEPPIEPAYK